MDNGKQGSLRSSSTNGSTDTDESAQTAACAVIMLDRTANVLSWNSGAERLFGYFARAAIGKSFYHFLDLESMSLANFEWALQTAYYRGMAKCDQQFTNQDGSQ